MTNSDPKLSGCAPKFPRQRGEIQQLQRAGISTASAEALPERMLANIDGMCAERDKLKKALAGPTKVKVLGERSRHV